MNDNNFSGITVDMQPWFADWGTLLEKIQDYYPEAIIAGGAIRDALHGVRPKDIDIFIHIDANKYSELMQSHPRADSEEYLKARCREFDKLNIISGLDIKKVMDTTGYSSTLREEVYLVIKAKYKTWDVDIVFLKPHAPHAVDSFDMSINQVWFDGSDSINLHGNYVKTIQTGFIKILKQDSAFRIEQRKKRILQKYPQYRFE